MQSPSIPLGCGGKLFEGQRLGYSWVKFVTAVMTIDARKATRTTGEPFHPGLP